MSARSSTPSVALAVAAVVAGCGGKHVPEADPQPLIELARAMIHATPAPAAVRDCVQADLVGATMTHVTLARIARQKLADLPLNADWINPPELDAPAARVLADARADEVAARRAAAELAAAAAYVVYRVDIVDAPIAIGVKDPKIGTVVARAIRYERDGRPTCVMRFAFQNTKAKNEWALAHSDRPTIDAAVSKAMRDDLTAQYLEHVPRAAAPAAPKS